MSLGRQFYSEDDLDCVWLNQGSIFMYTPSNTSSVIAKIVIEGKTDWGIPLALVAQKLKLSENDAWRAACGQEVIAQAIFEPGHNGERELRIAFRASINRNAPVAIGSRPIN